MLKFLPSGFPGARIQRAAEPQLAPQVAPPWAA
jgi:hypothetical protein